MLCLRHDFIVTSSRDRYCNQREDISFVDAAKNAAAMLILGLGRFVSLLSAPAVVNTDVLATCLVWFDTLIILHV